ncbi:MAG: TetR/AcrR family transcriptional regulator C-terminal domain-containing protein [Eubacteriales bacterium]|nr:TetR/AcrR family transcriptional regulator C-terminal domain-containing protein [Eubacteriales bacterium]
MQRSQATKKKLAKALKELAKTKPLDKISIQCLTDACGLNRQTFYYHFTDIYQLVEWIFLTEALEDMPWDGSPGSWQMGLRHILEYSQENRSLCLAVYRSGQIESLIRFFDNVIYGMLLALVKSMTRDEAVPEDDLQEIAHFFSPALREYVFAWVRRGMTPSPAELIRRLEVMFNGVLEHALERSRRQAHLDKENDWEEHNGEQNRTQ